MAKAVDVIYTCMICGRAWSSKQSLRAHMKAHRGEGYQSTHIVVRSGQWEEFKKLCRRHHSTTCQVLDGLIKMVLVGEARGVIDLRTPNPITLSVSQVFLGAPRSKWKFPLELGFRGRLPVCRSAYEVRSVDGAIACSRWGRNVSVAECDRCGLFYAWMEVR